MRKPYLPLVIIGLVAVVGVFFALTYKFPEVEAYQFYQKIDQNIVTCEKKSSETLEDNLNKLHVAVRDLIVTGQTYDGTQDVTDLFVTFNAQGDELKTYVETVTSCMNGELESIDFSKLDSVLTKIPEELVTLAKEMSTYEQARIESLKSLNEELIALNDSLSQFEEMFYNTKTSEAVQYFENINVIFTKVEDLHTNYVTSMTDYYAAKTAYYEQIANKGVMDYLFKK